LEAKPEWSRLRIGTLTTPITVKPSYHIYADLAAEWYEFTDTLPRYAEREVGCY